MPYYGGDYPLLPHEEISESEYNSMINSLKPTCMSTNKRGEVTFRVNNELLADFERQLDTEYESYVTDDSCKSGCPIR
jgi:hypothetical protein